jgi:imidazolonepropionase-like amidohydrolase
MKNICTLFALALLANPAFAATEKFVVITGGKTVGRVNADTTGDKTTIDFDIKNNGRGPSSAETITVDANGLPTAWTISGATTFGSKVAENFARKGNSASWLDATGPGKATVKAPSIYIGQSVSPWALGLYARAILKQPKPEIAALPGGTLRLVKGDTLTVGSGVNAMPVTRYSIMGIDTGPSTILLAADNRLFASVSPNAIVIRAGYEAEEKRLRDLAATWETERFVAIEKRVAHRYNAPIRIKNVRIFDPATSKLTMPMSVVVNGRTIAGVEPIDSPATPGEVSIDGAGGTLIAGMTEMHGHFGQDDALLNLVAGITTVRDMGNDNAVLDDLIAKMDAGTIGGPRVVRSGFIEGKSPFNSNNGFVVDSEAKALDAVRWYGARGFWQIKIYNSINPAWVPAMVAEAHRLGMRVAGHVPAFSTADAMMAAGYDEITHINQFMLGWVIKPEEDTRTLFRLTALKRLPGLDLNSAPVQATINTMVTKKIAIDPTIGIHENLTQNRDGKIPPGMVDYFDHMPIGTRRDAMKGWIDVSAPGDDAAYRGAYDKILATLGMLHKRGVFIVPGTDTGGALTFHRELELMQKIGMTAPEVLKRATFDMAQYLGEDQRRGSIAKGKLADFFLVPGDPTTDLKAIKTISMVVKDGTVYFPTEVYPEFGIRPFTAAPKVTTPSLP